MLKSFICDPEHPLPTELPAGRYVIRAPRALHVHTGDSAPPEVTEPNVEHVFIHAGGPVVITAAEERMVLIDAAHPEKGQKREAVAVEITDIVPEIKAAPAEA